MVSRVRWIRFVRWITASHWILGIVAIAALIVLRRLFTWREGEIWVLLALVGIWLLSGLVLVLCRRMNTFEALSILDRVGGWKDRFSSAWAFLASETGNPAERLHIDRASELLPEAVKEVPRDLAVPSLRNAWILPLLALLLSVAPIGRVPLDAGEVLLSEEMVEAAGEQADALRRESERVREISGLTEEERAELEKLRVEVEDVAEELADADGMTAGEMLAALENRARAAERLAEKMGLANDEWASAEMIAEMESHPDTANLALAIKDKAAEPAATEASGLQEILEANELPEEKKERITGALESIMGEATDEDSTKPVGERVGNASTKMLADQPKTAAREFEELAKHFRFLLGREEAREKLEELANSLREAGSEVSGSELEQMEKIASENRGERSAPDGLQSIESGDLPEDLQKLLAPQMAQSGAQGTQPSPSIGPENSPPGNDVAPVPGEAGAGEGPGEGQEGSAGEMQAPVPGQSPVPGENGQGMNLADQAQDGKGAGQLLSAPVPGMNAGQMAPGAGMSLDGGSSSKGGQGGDQAGMGTADLVDNQTEALGATKDSEVVAQINEDGDSTVRAVEGEARRELATRSRQEIMTDFLAAEEQALDGKSLPMSRREHVIRYFSAIRRQFENSDGEE